MEKPDLNKVAQITLAFWIMKIIATTLGETLGDYISQTLGLGYTVGIIITLLFFGIVLSIQLYSKKYTPFYFWLVIIATTTLGTEISDFIDRSLGLGYTQGSFILFTLLVITLGLWYSKFKNLKVYPIFNRNKELYFWSAVLLSNSLGTAFGDYLSDAIGLSYLTGALVTAGMIALVMLLHYLTKANQILLFWIAFVFTRPFGATFGDFLTKPVNKGGLDLGTLQASIVSTILISLLIFISHKRNKKS
ncbi:membrane protein [Leeuwenhoekiella sp. MAR_2009_132]|uniref:COG4705 family protein n=1 Tax=Leeuwenhoekiella sp. MAR_2009_132 TaxID=1392489 RepID=UPI00048C66DC|nr:membrane protein [Leeuwenhoekiella sp. MAR_2009_132]